MRFLFELVPCCGSPTRRAQDPVVPSEDEERWLVSLPVTAAATPSRRGCRRKQRKPGALDWRPSLGSISEDLTPPPKPLNGAVASAGKGSKKRSAAGGGMKVHQPSYSDRYNGSSSMPTFMPTFSPTPFMF